MEHCSCLPTPARCSWTLIELVQSWLFRERQKDYQDEFVKDLLTLRWFRQNFIANSVNFGGLSDRGESRQDAEGNPAK